MSTALSWGLARPDSVGIDGGAWVALAGHGPCDRFALIDDHQLFIHRKAQRGVRLLRAAPPRLPERLAAVRAALPSSLPEGTRRLFDVRDLYLPFVQQAQEPDIQRLGFAGLRSGDVRSLLKLWAPDDAPELVPIARGLELAAAFCARYGTVLVFDAAS